MNRRRIAETRGRRAELLAAAWLILKGYRILARRARTGAGEIDLVAARGRVLAFVEVKARRTAAAAAYAVTPRQQTRLARAASAWRGRRPRFAMLQPRFDLVIVRPWRPPRHLRAAFRPEGAAALGLF